MEKVKLFKRNVVRIDMLMLIGGIALGTLLAGYDVVRGLSLGNLTGILSFMLMSSSVERAVNMTPSAASIHMVAGYISRYIIYALMLFAAIRVSLVTGAGAAVGLMGVRLAVVFAGLTKQSDQKGGVC